MIEIIDAAAENAWGYVLFISIVLVGYGVLLLALLFTGLAVRAAWRWLATHSWRHVVLLLEGRALKGRSHDA